MNIFQLIIRWFLRLKWWFLILPIAVASMAIYLTRSLSLQYKTDLTIYTGVISNNSNALGLNSGGQDWNIMNNSINNIINTIQSKETIKKLSIELYARLMINGNPNKDNNFIKAKHFKELYDITPKDVLKLIDKKSESETVQRLLKYEKPTRDNFIYGLLNWEHPYFSYKAFQENLHVRRMDNSDILQVTYEANDPGVAYQTLVIFSNIFGSEYRNLQFANTNNVIKHFEGELYRVGHDLRLQEDSLTIFNVDNRVINYDKQTEAIAFMDKDFSLRAQEVFFSYNNSKAALLELEMRLDNNIQSIKNNTEFLNKLDQLADINYSILREKTISLNDPQEDQEKIGNLNKNLLKKEEDFKNFMGRYVAQKYTKDGYPNSNFVAQWVDELLKFKKAEAEVKVVKDFQSELDSKYSLYSPIGSEIKRKERSINFTEQSYLSILSSLNEARLRLKSLEMNSAVLKVINPPSFPLTSMPSKRKMIVAGSYFGTLIFLFGFFLILELLDRTLRDKLRTERITNSKVIGAFAPPKTLKNSTVVEEKIVHGIANTLFGLYNPSLPFNIINVITLSKIKESNRIAEKISNYWSNLGLISKAFFEGTDFKYNSREYLIGRDWKEKVKAFDIAFIQHAPFSTSLIPSIYLQEGLATLIILEADTVFDFEEELVLNSIKERMDGKPLLICLINAKSYVIEEFTGLLPPYTFIRKLGYRLSNFGLTSKS